MKNTMKIAVVGVGGFSLFAVTEFVKNENVKLIGGYDLSNQNVLKLKEIDASAIIFSSLEEVCAAPEVDLVYIATPPYLHYSQSKIALLSGKHVICEKPAALKTDDAKELRALAAEKNLLYVVNLMQRYNPLFDSVDRLIKGNLLGDFLHGYFENYASDEFLHENHWFWDEEKSGGIFIEHGVHFFDMFTGWLGEGKVIASQKIERENHPKIFDKVQATVQYGNGIVNFYHGFDQPRIMDRQEMRLLFEKGEITLYEWVPTQLKMTAICSEKELESIKSIFPKASIEKIETHENQELAKGRFKEIRFQYKIKLDTGNDVDKQTLYQELVVSMFNDQMNWINDNSHIRKINDDNAVTSLKLAEISEKIALKLNV